MQIFMSASTPALSRHSLDLATVSPLMQGFLVHWLQLDQPDQLTVDEDSDIDLLSDVDVTGLDGLTGLVVAEPQLI